jgi:branched-chain amino acid transport system permease protein
MSNLNHPLPKSPKLGFVTNAFIVATLIVLAVMLPLAPWLFKTSTFVITMLIQSSTYSIAILGMVIVLGYTGQINLAQAAFFGFGAYGVALGTTVYGFGFWSALVVGVLSAGCAGAILGLTTLRLGGHYLAMITISFQQIFDLIAVNWIDFTHGPDGISGIERPLVGTFAFTDDRAYLALCALVLYLLIALVWYLPGTRWGLSMRSVRENELAAEVGGVNTLRIKVTAFTLCAALGGLGGGLFAGGFAYVSPDNFNFARAIEFLSMALLGGVQSPFGGVIGTTLLILLPEWLKQMPPELQFIKDVYLAFYGLAVILIMVFMPEGIWGLVKKLWPPVGYTVLEKSLSKAQFKLINESASRAITLEIKNLQKNFGGLRAVDDLSIQVNKGTVHALIGPNGSGKTTTLNLVSGIYTPSSGQIFVEGLDITNDKPHLRAWAGVGRTFQNIRLFSNMSVLENVMIGAQRENNPALFKGSTKTVRDCALEAISFVGLESKQNELVLNLPYGHQRLVEIARALAGHPVLLLLDEPAAGLNQTEKGELVQLLKKLRQGHGLTIFLIDHDMKLVGGVSDVITVLNFGRKIAEGTPDYVLNHPQVIAAYLGAPDATS